MLIVVEAGWWIQGVIGFYILLPSLWDTDIYRYTHTHILLDMLPLLLDMYLYLYIWKFPEYKDF